MSTSVSQLLELCERTYNAAAITAGPNEIHGANVFTLPDNTVVLCFRGTLANHDFQSALDWLGDFHAELVSADGFPGKVHEGFLAALNALWDGVMAALEGHKPPPPAPPMSKPKSWWNRLFDKMFPPAWEPFDEAVRIALSALNQSLPWDKDLIITGHSKGGALAQLAAVRLAALKPKVITFAAPMVGDITFANEYPEAIDLLRIEGNFDLVPFLPGRLAGYREVGTKCRTQPPTMFRHLREIAIGTLLAEGKWEQVRANHSLSTGYSWCRDEPPDRPATRVAA